ncbi:pyridoxal phosphate-dependent transferase [Stachybotrys elegans]|uniref:Pyridoxal phosphate-dependent transferase n=1 Tax=Stachybotrys elegans TaxID=80388 RepID=A0A8K0WNH2_9HYPO|nr:pyridoxal phosphate-dependent transferase [Stachybotrys elegans]
MEVPVDLSHHINEKSRARHPSPLKDIIKFMGEEGMISLAGGLPHPSLFPLHEVSFKVPGPPGLGQPLDARQQQSSDLTIGRDPVSDQIDLTQFLQYGNGSGNRQLLALCNDLTQRVHAPPCQYQCLLHPGNTNAWAKVVGLLCEDKDFVIVEEYTYPSAQALWVPLGIKAVPVAADEQGIQAGQLRQLLEDWDEDVRGAKRPHVLYLVSVGSNPTGITISAQRRLVEDDPYYFLQYPSYQDSLACTKPQQKTSDDFLKTLTPSFLSLDTQGRVIRLESFSKTLFPGLRLGYFVANPLFTERLLRATEVETQDPAGLSQAYVLGILQSWGIDGYLSWLQSLQFQYLTRRNWLLDSFSEHFTLEAAEKSPLTSADSLVASIRTKDGTLRRPVFSFVDPTAGMFVWSKFYFDKVPRFIELQRTDHQDPEQAFADELWKAWASELVLLTPGSYYHPWQGFEKTTTKARGADPSTAHFRFSFATPTQHEIRAGVKRMSEVIQRFWE